MAGLSKIADGSALDSFKTLQKLQSSGLSFDSELGLNVFTNVGDEHRGLFEQLLCCFLKEVNGSKCFRPFPPILGDGQSVDLFKLYFLVRERGGQESVSENGLWGSVAQDLKLFSGFGSAVKLVYIKYLDSLDRWLQRIVRNKDSMVGLQDSDTDPGSVLMELETDYQKDDEEISPTDLGKSDLNVADIGEVCNGSRFQRSEQKKEGKIENNIGSDSSAIMSEDSNRKRKRECIVQRMLDWVVEAAKDPCNLELGLIPERSLWKDYGIEHLWKQILLVREAMFLKRNADIRPDQSISDWLMKQKMHPTMYDDPGQRCSPRLVSAKESAQLSSKRSLVRACSESFSGTQINLDSQFEKESDNSSPDPIVGWFGEDYDYKQVPIGPSFQVNVLEWTGETKGSDSKWLGSRVWPQESNNNKFLIERDRIGKGRHDSCGCQYPGSTQCVKFHVTEKKIRLKLELGLAFYRWKFDKMGEEVALSWTKEQEKRFLAVIKSIPPTLDKSFWDQMFKSFASKSREDLVSYYFNVFVLRRRGCQNRSDPNNIDSDEESEFVSLSNRFGHGAVTSPKSIFHSPKKPHLNSK